MFCIVLILGIPSEFKGVPSIMTVHLLGGAPPPIHVRCVGLNLGGGTKWSRRGSLCKARQDVGEKLAFPQQLSEKLHVETWAGGCKSLNLRISQEQEIEGRCAVEGFPPRTPFVTLVLPGPGSDIRMKMGWKIMTKTEKSGVWFFQNAGDLWRRWVLLLLVGAVDGVWKGS